MNRLFIKTLVLLVGCFYFLNILAGPALAEYKTEIGLPGLPPGTAISDPAQYVRTFLIFGISIVGFLAVGTIALGGIQYMLAGSVGSVEKAKALIFGALWGVGLLLCSYLLLYTIDPALTDLSLKELSAINIPEPPSPPDSGLTERKIEVAAGTNEIKCKTTKICQDVENGQLNGAVTKILSSLATPITITETTGSHGCSSSDSCVSGAACGTSTHCSGRAVDLRVRDLTSDQVQATVKALSANPCTDQLFYSGFPQYCRAGGGQNASGSKNCSNHSDHIHYSVKAGCS